MYPSMPVPEDVVGHLNSLLSYRVQLGWAWLRYRELGEIYNLLSAMDDS